MTPDRLPSGALLGSGEPDEARELSEWLELAEMRAKIDRGERLTNDERARRQGLIFNHPGKPSGFCVI